MQVTLTGSFVRHQIEKREGGSAVYAGSDYIGVRGSTEYIACYVPGSGEAFDENFRDTLSGAVITLKIKAKGNVTPNAGGLYINIYSQPVYDSYPQDTYDRMRMGSFIAETMQGGNLAAPDEKELVFIITKSASVRGLLSNGFGLFATGLQNSYIVSSVSLEITGESSEPAPEISVDQGYMTGTYTGGVYYHPAGDTDFYAGITYSHSLGVSMEYMRYTIRGADGVVLQTGQTSGKSFMVPRSVWNEIPASGEIEMVAVSAHGIPSSPAVLPWVISHYDVRVSTPVSGTILDTGEDVVLRWDLVLPNGMPSAPTPSRYTIWPAWDDESDFQVAYGVTERTYTIPAESFAGHTRLKLLILDEYGTNGAVVRRKGDGRLIMLYLQPSAAVTGIEVSPQYSPGKYKSVLTVSWRSEGQSAFRVRAPGFDSGPVWGTDTAYTIPKVFEDGVQEIRLRIQDATGRWGEWSDPVYVTVDNQDTTGGTADLRADKTETGARLTITAAGSEIQFADVLIYRNGLMIAQLPGTSTMEYQYTDTGASGMCAYYVRLMMGSGFYAQTDTVTIDATPETDGMILEDGTWLPLRYTRSFPRQYGITNREETYQRYYAGRRYPVSVRSGRRSRIVNMEYTDKGTAICDRLEEATGSVVTYKTVLGDVIRGELNQVNSNKGKLYSIVSFRLTECDWVEEVMYTSGVTAYNV